MKILAFSDVHWDLKACRELVQAGAEADLVIGVGDFAQQHQGLNETMAALEPLAAKAIYVPGNNETPDELRAATSARVLHGEGMDFQNQGIVGIGGAIPPLPPLPWGSYDLDECTAATMLADFDTADIFMTHSPPKGAVDVHSQAGSIGSTSVLTAIQHLRPTLVFCGHVHDCWGQVGKIGSSQVFNLGPTVNWFEI